jgi:hypothetical protein
VSAGASFEVHPGYPGPAHWSSSSGSPALLIVVIDDSTPATPEGTPTPKVELMAIDAITADRIGKVATVEETVVGATTFSRAPSSHLTTARVRLCS